MVCARSPGLRAARSDVDAVVGVGELEVVHHGSTNRRRQARHNLLRGLRPVALQDRVGIVAPQAQGYSCRSESCSSNCPS